MGFTLGKFFTSHGNKVTGYASRNTQSAIEAAQFTQTEAYDDIGRLIHDSDVCFLTVPDGRITDVYRDICRYPIRGKLICHCSGALSSEDAFPGIEQTGAYGYSVHPLFAVSDRYTAYRELQDVFFTVEGDPEHLEDILDMLKDMGLRTRTIAGSDKVKYHAAAAMASNLVIALISASVNTLTECGFSQAEGLAALTPLIRGNAEHVLTDGLAESLTGPVERGDVTTIRKHLECLDDREVRTLYRLLSKQLIPIAAAKHPARSYQSIEDLLND